MTDHPGDTKQTRSDGDGLFVIGRGIGPVGRWLRLFLGLDTLIYLVVNPLYLHPMAQHALPDFLLTVIGCFLLIGALYFGVFALIGDSILARLNPWVGTSVYLGIPAVLALSGAFPQTVQVAFGLYVGIGLILLFFMRYGGCELVALPSLILRRRFTVYCPYNAIDAIERAVTPDGSYAGHRVLTIVSLAIVILVGGYFVLVRWNDLLGQFGIAVRVDTRWSLLLLVPCAQLAGLAFTHYRRQRTILAPRVRKYALGAIVLALAIVVSLFPGHGLGNILFLTAMALGAAFALIQVAMRMARRSRPQRRSLTGESPIATRRDPRARE